MKVILPQKSLSLLEGCREFEYMQKVLSSYQNFNGMEQQQLFSLLYNAIDVALYYGIEKSAGIEKHIEFLVNFSKKFFIDNDLNSQYIKQLHKSILPPNIKSDFIYESLGKKRQEILRGEYRTINTYL